MCQILENFCHGGVGQHYRAQQTKDVSFFITVHFQWLCTCIPVNVAGASVEKINIETNEPSHTAELLLC